MTQQTKIGPWFSRSTSSLKQLAACVGIYGSLTALACACNIYTISDGNSALKLDVSEQRNAFDWNVDGQDALKQQSFWFRIGDKGPEESLDTLGKPKVVQYDDSTLKTTYANNKVSVQVQYSLVGGAEGSGEANLAQQIKIQNLTNKQLDFHFFQYADWNIDGTTQLGQNLQGLYDEALITSVGSSVIQTIDTALSPGANHGIAGLNTLAQLNDKIATTLADFAGPSTNSSWTLEWDRVIGAKGTLILSQVLTLDPVPVPEPSTGSMMLMGLIGCLWVGKLIDRG